MVAGVIIYVDELCPSREDFQKLKLEINSNTTDVRPIKGSQIEKILKEWTPNKAIPNLAFDFRLQRAIRIITINDNSIADALKAFDNVVKDIEQCRGREANGFNLLGAWDRNSSDENTCVLCDSRTFCPDYKTKYSKKHNDLTPKLPQKK